jgi:hypothetical protein
MKQHHFGDAVLGIAENIMNTKHYRIPNWDFYLLPNNRVH